MQEAPPFHTWKQDFRSERPRAAATFALLRKSGRHRWYIPRKSGQGYNTGLWCSYQTVLAICIIHWYIQ